MQVILSTKKVSVANNERINGDGLDLFRVEWIRLLKNADGAKVLEGLRSNHVNAADKAIAEAQEKLEAGDLDGARRCDPTNFIC